MDHLGEGKENGADLNSHFKDTGHEGGNDTFERSEVVRVMLKALKELGYDKALTALEEESGFGLHPPEYADLVAAVNAGQWDQARSTLEMLRFADSDGLAAAKFAVAEQQYLELLEASSLADALDCLQNELAPCKPGSSQVDELSSLLLCGSPQQLRTLAKWSGVEGESRKLLLKKVCSLLAPSDCVPDNRLQILLHQAQQHQISQCPMHNTLNPKFSLYTNHKCDKQMFPTETRCILEVHTDEIWHITFSPNGDHLASTGSDKLIALWEVSVIRETNTGSSLLKPRLKIENLEHPQHFLCWCPNSKHLLSCSDETNEIKLWNTSEGTCIHTYDGHADSVSSIAWLSDSRFVSGSLDKTILLWDVGGEVQARWEGLRVNDLAVACKSQNKEIVALCAENRLRSFIVEDSPDVSPRLIEISDQRFVEAMMSICISQDGRQTLIAAEGGEIRCWDNSLQHVSARFSGHRQGRFVLRPCFGGFKETFVICGGEDSQVYVWHRSNGSLLSILPGHSGTVNSVAWNPKDVHMFASASDDTTIRIWGLSDLNDGLMIQHDENSEKIPSYMHNSNSEANMK